MKTNRILGGIVAASLIISVASVESATVQVLDRGPNHRVVEATRLLTNELGEIKTQTSRYTEIEGGLHRYENGQWVESEELIELNSEGYATASRGAYKVIFNQNLNTVGAIDLLTPDQKRLRSHVLGIYLTDSASGKSSLIATVKDSAGVLLPPNQIIYPSAFEGLAADMRFTYRKGFFEADLILKENLILPEGFDPNTTRLELVTEFVDSPEPVVKRFTNGANLVDDALLDFGGMEMIPGKAFSINETAGALDGQNSSVLHVQKKWQRVNGRQLLIESVSWNEAEAHLKSLPTAAVNEQRPTRQASVERELPTKQLASNNSKPMSVASLPYTHRGFVIDYVTVVTQSSWTFQSGQTYLVPGLVTISSSLTIQSGAIVKYDRLGQITLSGTLTCPTDDTAILTARDDTSIGEDTSTGALTGYYGGHYYIQLYNTPYSATFKKLNVRYAKEAIFAYTPYYAHTVRDSRFENCNAAVGAYYSTMTLNNLIMCNTSIQTSNHGSAYFYPSLITTNCYGSVRFTTLTDGKLLTGQTNIPIEVVSGDFGIAGIRLWANGNEARMYSINAPNTTLTWNTGFSTNGSYPVNLTADFYFSSVTGAVKTVTLSNTVAFATAQSLYGDTMWVYAKLSIQSADYRIDMYGENDNYLGFFSGSTSDGTISFLWDLTDPPRSDMKFTGKFFVAAAGAPLPGSPSGTRFWNGEAVGWIDGGFVVAWAALNSNGALTAKLNEMVTDGVVNILDANYTLNSGNTPNANAFRLTGDTRDALLVDLRNVGFRNFYYFGHGLPSAIGAWADAKSVITDSQMRTNLGNYLGQLLLSQTNLVSNHPFTFVWLDGCETGKGKYCEAFGIHQLPQSLADYAWCGIKPRAFLGFKANTTTNPQQTGFRASMMGTFFGDWVVGKTLYYCVTNAAANQSYPIESSWVIYGATKLTRFSAP